MARGGGRVGRALDLLEPEQFARLRARSTALTMATAVAVALVGWLSDGGRPPEVSPAAWWAGLGLGAAAALTVWVRGARFGDAAFFVVVASSVGAVVWSGWLVAGPGRGLPFEMMLLTPVALAGVFCRDGRFVVPLTGLACAGALALAAADPGEAVPRAAMSVTTVLTVAVIVRVLRTVAVAAIAEARTVAATDHLTGLLNRHGVQERAGLLWERQHRLGGALAVILVDIDRFKDVNDTFGHARGDDLLQHVARRLGPHAGRAGLLGRWGGEEFLLVVPVAPGGSARVGEQVRLAVRNTWTAPVTVSVGVHETVPGPAADLPEGPAADLPEQVWRAVAAADDALYAAKRAGRDRVSTST